MEIKLHTTVDSVARVSTNTPAKASRPIDSDSDVSVFETSRALEARLKDLPDVRADKVEDGKRLIGDPAYPPRETIRRIAALLALNETDGDSQVQQTEQQD